MRRENGIDSQIYDNHTLTWDKRGFKALKKIVKLNFKTGKFENMLTKYKLFLTYIKSAVTSNYSEKGINSILDLASTSTDLDLIQQVYDITLKSLLDAKNEVFLSSPLFHKLVYSFVT